MNTATLKLLRKGKNGIVNRKMQKYINLFVMAGFLFFFIWITFLYPNTFINIYFVLSLLFLPSLIITFFMYRKILSVCGYSTSIDGESEYKLLISVAVYFLVMIPVGNILVTVFLFANYAFAQKEIQTITLKPYNIGWSTNKSNNYYSHIEVDYDNISKQIKLGDKDVNVIPNQIFKIKVSKGLFGYYVIKGYKFQPKE